MIIIDGRQSEMQVHNFANLEEILVNVMQDDGMESRVITDVLLNDEQFSEIYPHQAEDIGSDNIRSVEVRSVPSHEMAFDISQEMQKVTRIMQRGGGQVARLFRQGEDAEALELLQDLLDVMRDFMAMLGTLRVHFVPGSIEGFDASVTQFSALITEMSDVLENEDWILLADLLEYEFLPVCDTWNTVAINIQETLRQMVRQ